LAGAIMLAVVTIAVVLFVESLWHHRQVGTRRAA
jgi:hypothetical protein